MQIYESAENYLKTILQLQQRKENVHSIDVAEELGFSKASVSIAMKKLRENGYITMDKDGTLHLLEPGKAVAERIDERHRILTSFLVSLGVDQDTALQDACRVEHDLTEQSFDRIREFVEKNGY
ncbi:MAG: metal-dependent transcriptional regulator [Solobacterium sp.]|nr:metal-dependent transcriptional regulator [Erysipelotrichaceae bacterium]MBQ1326062.1 metal-dependent transcriptional regulator [Solobacterium sp.]MBQ1382599.1 metal-dependent transcriptional regulator [Solobacterium sp.]MBQ1447130.1 metal-dependent transcriptional regulator [Solobacterium sp.]MBQ2690361.1 metal-dependent transcriptional regulator [Solobacterium sp.]